MGNNKETIESWNKVAELYEEKFMDLDLYDESYLFFCDMVQQEEAQILDVGCGPGNITKFLLSRQVKFDIEGIDVASNMVALAAKNNPKAHFKVMDCRDLSALHKKYDGIICGFCLPYLNPGEAKQLITEAHDLLNKDGVFYLSFVEGKARDSGFKIGSSGDRMFFYYHEVIDVSAMLSSVGISLIKTFEVEFTRPGADEKHLIMIGKKR